MLDGKKLIVSLLNLKTFKQLANDTMIMTGRDRILTGILVLAVIIAVATILYVNFYGGEENIHEEKILTVVLGDTKMEYTLSDLKNLESYKGNGRYIKTKLLPDSVVISESHQYTGVRVTTLLEQFNNLPVNYAVTIQALDGWSINYTQSQIQGHVTIYDENGEVIDNATATMIIAYAEDGEYYMDSNPEVGPLRVAFVDGNPITPSNLWVKMVTRIEIHSSTS